ncbi:ABC transporter permease [Candidatus Pacearchaeota archaeon]|nr:ABC transporter permease [Candidatus Pacearchaeota archaeon]
MNLDYLILALKNLKHRGIRSWLTLLGIFIGVTAVVSLISLGNGLETAVGAQFGISSTEVITVQAGGVNSFGAPGSGAVNRLTNADVQAIEGLSSVDLAIGRNIETFKMEYNDVVVFNAGAGFHEGEKGKWDYEMQNIEAEKGRLLQAGDRRKVILGYNYMFEDKSGFEKAVQIGDKINLNDVSFRVVGIMSKKGSLIIDNIIGITVSDLDSLVDNEDYVDVISVKVKRRDLMDSAAEDIKKLLRDRRDVDKGEEDFEVSTPEAMMETVNSVLGGVQAFVVIIASISILVGALGIVNTMTTSVLERRNEIGIMKAIGAKNSQVFMQFFFESGMLGLVGGLVGIIFGTLVGVIGISSINNFLGTELTPIVDFVLIGGALVGSFVIGAVAGIVPAMNAAKQNPVEALRG